ncbi:MAG: hypothetical protein HY505_00295 [Candidatus Yanofskybacteria bacterium]|nr:hypothetical protein [Candidatus Yanofskybacteria bacterium]
MNVVKGFAVAGMWIGTGLLSLAGFNFGSTEVIGIPIVLFPAFIITFLSLFD